MKMDLVGNYRPYPFDEEGPDCVHSAGRRANGEGWGCLCRQNYADTDPLRCTYMMWLVCLKYEQRARQDPAP